MKQIKKYFINIFLLIILIINVNAVSVVQVQDPNQIDQAKHTSEIGGVTINWDFILKVVLWGVGILIVILILMWIFSWIIKKIREERKKMEDIEFRKYKLDLKVAFMNKNSKYKHRNPFLLWIFWSRAKIYARTSYGRKFIGKYDGELVKKEGYYVIAIQLTYSLFEKETDLLLFPFNLKDELVKFNEDGTIDIECEGIDETLSSQYFSLPVFKNTSDKEKAEMFADFSNEIMENYFRRYVYRDVIKTTIKDFANNVHDVTEMNPHIPLKRKTGNDLHE